MVLALHRGPRWHFDANRVIAVSGVLLLHILLLGMMFLPREQLPFLPKADAPYTPIVDFDPLPPPPQPPPPPIVVPPPPTHLVVAPPPPIALPMVAPMQPTTNSEIVLDTPTETPVLPYSEFEAGNPITAVATVSKLVTLETTFDPPPIYPRRELIKGIGGNVELRVLVGADGLPQKVEVLSSSGNRNLEMAAERAVKRWRFKPYVVAGVAIPVWAQVPIVFRIEN
jgi:protein TonB